MKQVFLESHNIKNQHFGFGQFNYHLIKGLYNANIQDFKITLHVKDIAPLKEEFGTYFNYKTYHSLRRYPLFRIRKQYDVWHSLNQNIKIEPYHDIPYVLTVHDVNFIDEVSNDLNHEVNVRFQQKLNRSKAITYISEYAKKSTHDYFKVPDVPEHVIYNGNPIRAITLPEQHRPKLTSKRPFLFSIGEFTPRKNFHTLIEMLVHLPEFNLVLSGNNSTDYASTKLAQTISDLNLEERVIITGKLTISTSNITYNIVRLLSFHPYEKALEFLQSRLCDLENLFFFQITRRYPKLAEKMHFIGIIMSQSIWQIR